MADIIIIQPTYCYRCIKDYDYYCEIGYDEKN
jgi:hypothetical protein